MGERLEWNWKRLGERLGERLDERLGERLDERWGYSSAVALMKYPGVGEEDLLYIQAQQVAGNLLYWEVFMRLSKVKKPMMKMLLVESIYNKHMLQYRRATIITKIDELIYTDRALVKTTLGHRQYVVLSEKGRKIAEMASKFKEIEIPPPPGT